MLCETGRVRFAISIECKWKIKNNEIFDKTFEMKRDRCVHLVNIKELITTRNDGRLIISNRLDDKKKCGLKIISV